MDRIAELLALLSDPDARARLTDAELAAIREELGDAGSGMWAAVRSGEMDGVEQNDTATLRTLGECISLATGESDARTAGQTAALAEADEMERSLGLAPAPAAADTDEAAAAAVVPQEPAGDGEAPAVTAEAGDAAGDAGEAGDGVQAGATPPAAARVQLPTLAQLNARTPAARRDVPTVRVSEARGGEIRWMPTGEIVDREEFVNRLAAFPEQYAGGMPFGVKTVLGRVDTVPDTAQRITENDSSESISRKLDLAVAGALDPRNWRDGAPSDVLQASGGWGTPSPVVYDIPQISVADRPVRDALASVAVTRGGLTWVPAPKFSDITTGGPGVTGAATGIWTNATDTTPGATVKSKQTIPASTTRTVQLDALYMQLQEGVLQSRAFPEWVRAWVLNTEAAWARMAETNLLDKIESSSILKFATQQVVIGATRDILAAITQLAAAERQRQRMRPDAMVRCLYPSYLADLVQIDLVRAGTNFVDSSPLLVARSFIEGQLRNANINASPYMDSSTAGGQLISTQPTHAHLNALPSICRTYLFHEGVFVVGDGGREDIGVVRDSTLVNTNDFRIFNESFEGLFDRGIWAYCLDSYLCPDGVASAAKDISKFCTGS